MKITQGGSRKMRQGLGVTVAVAAVSLAAAPMAAAADRAENAKNCPGKSIKHKGKTICLKKGNKCKPGLNAKYKKKGFVCKKVNGKNRLVKKPTAVNPAPPPPAPPAPPEPFSSLAFSGAINGQVGTQPLSCTDSEGKYLVGAGLNLDVDTVFEVSIPAGYYTGPGTYPLFAAGPAEDPYTGKEPKAILTHLQGPHYSSRYGPEDAATGQVVINPDLSGSVYALMRNSDQTAQVEAVGNWVCERF